MKKDDKIKKWLNGILSEEEMRDFKETDDFKEIEKIDKYIVHFKAPDYNVNEEKTKLRETSYAQNSRSLYTINNFLKIAASLLIISSIAFIYFESSDQIQTITSNDRTELHLPDSSFLRLNHASSISYTENNWKDERYLKLSGEAYFEVTEGSQFAVETPHGKVTVLGTEFNVKARPDYFEVICYEGKVRVESTQTSKVLSKGDKIQIIDKTLVESTVEDLEPSWLNGNSSFNSVPLKTVLKELELQYSIKIQSKDIQSEKLFSGSFTNNNLDLALKSITIPMNLSYEIDEGLVILSGGSND